jgi:two-component SAPR family response regulator
MKAARDLLCGCNLDADYWLDTEALQQAFSGEWPVDELIETVSVYNGDLLPGFYGDWVSLERERLQSAFERQMELEQAAQFYGAAERLREIIGAPLPPVERPVYERNVAAVRAYTR